MLVRSGEICLGRREQSRVGDARRLKPGVAMPRHETSYEDGMALDLRVLVRRCWGWRNHAVEFM